MRQPPVSLCELRDEIERIDDEIHDLLMRRAAIAAALAPRPEGDGAAALATPAERARILRRILGRHQGDLPLRSVAHIWSEIMAAGSRRPRALHVCAGDQAVLYRDLARVYFGSLAPITSHGSALAAVQACAADESGAIGVLPWAESGEEGASWWAHLAPAGKPGARIVARLPFVQNDGGEPPFPWAFAIGGFEQEPTGNDTTLLLLETEGELSRTRLQSFLQQTGFNAQILAAGSRTGGGGAGCLLLSNRGFVGVDDPRLDAFLAKTGETLLRIVPIGGYANPLDEPAEAERS
jgi:chorismate mutase